MGLGDVNRSYYRYTGTENGVKGDVNTSYYRYTGTENGVKGDVNTSYYRYTGTENGVKVVGKSVELFIVCFICFLFDSLID